MLQILANFVRLFYVIYASKQTYVYASIDTCIHMNIAKHRMGVLNRNSMCLGSKG